MLLVGTWIAYSKGWILADFKFVTAKEGARLIANTKSLVLDVRTKKEWNKGHINGAKLIPLSELKSRVGELKEYKGKEIIVYSRSGSKSITAGRFLVKEGFKPINVKSGIIGLAIEGGKKYPKLFTNNSNN
jgi:rhodanese-related sulfurtransferase